MASQFLPIESFAGEVTLMTRQGGFLEEDYLLCTRCGRLEKVRPNTLPKADPKACLRSHFGLLGSKPLGIQKRSSLLLA